MHVRRALHHLATLAVDVNRAQTTALRATVGGGYLKKIANMNIVIVITHACKWISEFA